MNEESMWKPAMIAGVILGILSAFPYVGCFCCVWMIGGGILAAYLYVKDSPTAVTLGRGVGLGLLAGIIGAIVFALFSIPLHILNHSDIRFVDEMRRSMDRMPNMPPESRKMMEAFFEEGKMGTVLYVFGFIFTLFGSGVLGMLGGAIGVAIFERRKPNDPFTTLPPGPPLYQPPSGTPPPPSPPTDIP